MLYGSVGRVGLRALSGTSFSPLSLFANGEQGVWLDNSDFTTLFQDAAGTTPVTGYEQFVGLRLDKSKGLVLGSEKWTGSPTLAANWSGGSGTYTSNGGTGFITVAAIGSAYLTVGKVYKTSFTVSNVTAGSVSSPYDGEGSNAAYKTANGTYERIFRAAADGLYIYSNGFAGTVSNISVRELPGNHAFQTTTTARAVLSARYNQLTYTEQFDNAAWTKSGVNPSGTTITATGSNAYLYQAPLASAASHLFTAKVKAGTSSVFWLFYNNVGSHGAAYFDLSDQSTQIATGSIASPSDLSITSLGSGEYRIAAKWAAVAASNNWGVGISDAKGSISVTNGRTASLYSADLRVANESSALPAYQRVGAAVNGTSTSIGTPDYDTVGFPAYLRYDGGDWYQTNSIDFSTGATNPPLGPELVTNGDFSGGTTGWGSNTTFTSTGSATSGYMVVTNTVNFGMQISQIATEIGKRYRITGLLRKGTGNAQIRVSDTTGGTGSLIVSSVVSATDWMPVTLWFTATANPMYVMLGGTATSGLTHEYDNISVRELTDANYAPDKMSVFAGVRKFNAAGSFGILVELSSAAYLNPGSFAIAAPGGLVGNTDNFGFTLVGSGTAGYDAVSYPPPFTAILAVQYNIGAASPSEEVVPRINAVLNQTGGAGTTAGTGTFGNYPLYIGARNAGASLPFTGREYETIVLGRAVTVAELANTEGYMEAQTFGKDMVYTYLDELTTSTGDLITTSDGDQIYMTVVYQ